MAKKNYFIYSFIVLSIFLSACIKEYDLSNDADITYFYIINQNGNNAYSTISFDITHPSDPSEFGIITNTDSLPYNALSDSLIPYFISSMSNQAYIYGSDTVIVVYSGTTKVDFSSTQILNVIADDGTNYAYRVELKASVVNPVGMNWSEKTDSIPVQLFDYMKAYRFKGKTWLLTGQLDPVTKTTTTMVYSSDDGTNWSTNGANWTFENASDASFPVGINHSICVYNDKLYSLGHLSLGADGSFVAKNEIWESVDGINWNKTGSLEGDNVIFREAVVFRSKLYVFGGSKIEAGYTPETDEYSGAERSVLVYDGNNWSKLADLPTDMPTRKGALGVFHNKLFYIGGESENGIESTIWVSGDGNYWAMVSEDNLQPTINANVFEYDDRLWLVGGEESGLTTHSIQESVTEGLNWYPIETLAEDGIVPYNGFLEARAGQSAFVDENNRVWVIGGYKKVLQGAGYTDLNLYDVWTGKMNKFK